MGLRNILLWTRAARRRRKIVKAVRDYQGIPYCWPPHGKGVDCSGYVSRLKEQGVTRPPADRP